MKAADAQAAGAVAVIVGNNAAGSPPAMGGTDPSITIPVVSITQIDASAIKAQLAGGVIATIGADTSHLAGTDAQGRPRMYAPNPIENGSSISHWDTPETPNLLMEPFIMGDLTGVDLTQYAFADIGWTGSVTGVPSDGPGSPAAPARAYAAPNPFSRGTAIHFTLTRPGRATIDIHDVAGALVRRLVTAPLPAGAQSVTWDGADTRGRAAATGIYFWRVRADGSYRAGGPSEIYSGRMVRVH